LVLVSVFGCSGPDDPAANDPAQLAELREDAAAVEKWIAHLDPPHRKVCRGLLEGKSLPELATQLSVSLRTIERRK
jgi:DNA-directed RNA polymerase specialized sigma24 family protein